MFTPPKKDPLDHHLPPPKPPAKHRLRTIPIERPGQIKGSCSSVTDMKGQQPKIIECGAGRWVIIDNEDGTVPKFRLNGGAKDVPFHNPTLTGVVVFCSHEQPLIGDFALLKPLCRYSLPPSVASC